MHSKLVIGAALALGIVLTSTCGDDSETCPIGSEGCRCTGGGSCDRDLVCASNTCVDLGGDADADTGSDGEAETYVARCGNGVLDPGEECDDGNRNNEDGCTTLCRPPACGDGITDRSREQCDDGNTTPGDGCDARCTREGAVCGNGTVEGEGSWREECDDGNTVNGDGCSANCFTEAGRCGDGTRQGTEECDDGNRTPGDGCDASCRRETPDGGDADADAAGGCVPTTCTDQCRAAGFATGLCAGDRCLCSG